MTNNYPFNRRIDFNTLEHIETWTLTGEFITQPFVRNSSNLVNDERHEIEMCANNPQILQPEYLLRYPLSEISEQSFSHLLEKKRSLPEILRFAFLVRKAIWEDWDEVVEHAGECDGRFYNTGSQSESMGTKSYRTWIIYSDLAPFFEYLPDDWPQNLHFHGQRRTERIHLLRQTAAQPALGFHPKTDLQTDPTCSTSPEQGCLITGTLRPESCAIYLSFKYMRDGCHLSALVLRKFDSQVYQGSSRLLSPYFKRCSRLPLVSNHFQLRLCNTSFSSSRNASTSWKSL